MPSPLHIDAGGANPNTGVDISKRSMANLRKDDTRQNLNMRRAQNKFTNQQMNDPEHAVLENSMSISNDRQLPPLPSSKNGKERNSHKS